MYRFFLGLLCIVLFAAACGSPTPEPAIPPTETPTPQPTATATHTPVPLPTATPGILPETTARDPQNQVYVRTVHAALDTGPLEVYIELLAVATNLNFAQGTEPTGIVAGDYNLRVVPAGAGLDGQTLLMTPISLRGGTSVILLITGTPDALTLATFNEQTEPLDSSQSRVSVIHAVPRGADFVLRDAANALTPPISFGQQSDGIVLPSGQTNFIFQSGDAILSTHPVNMRERYSYTLVLVGRPDDLNSLSVLDFGIPVPGRSTVRVINAAPAIGLVDVYLSNQLTAQNADYARPTERVSVPTGVYSVAVYAAGADPAAIEPLQTGQLNANPDDRLTLLIIGPPEQLRIVTYRESAAPTSPTELRIAFMNTLETVPRVRVEFPGGPIPGVPDLGYGQISAEIMLDAGSYDFFWNRLENNVVVEQLESASSVILEPGRSYLYLFAGRLLEPPIILSENVGINEQLAQEENGIQATSIPSVPTQVRFVNALTTATLIDFLVDDVVVAAAVPYGEDSPFVEVSPGEHVITVRNAGSSTLLSRLAGTFELPGSYSLFAYGSEIDTEVSMLLVPDFDLNFDTESAHLRLVNLTQTEQTNFGLAFSVPNAISPAPTDPTGTETSFRQTLTLGINRLLDNIASNSVSGPARIFPGQHSIIVVDNDRTSIAASIPSVDLMAGVHYDVVTFQEFGSLLVRVFILQYPES